MQVISKRILGWSHHALALGFALTTVLSVPANAVYKCILDGKTTFQELACPAGTVQSTIRPQSTVRMESEGGTSLPTDAANPGQSDQEKLDVLESARLRRDAAFALRDKVAQLANQQALCERNFGVIFSRGGPNNAITGAVYTQGAMGDTNLPAQRCIARTNELQQEVGTARAQCAARNCEKP